MTLEYFVVGFAVILVTAFFIPAVFAYIGQIIEYKRKLKTIFVVICYFELIVMSIAYALMLVIVISHLTQ